MTATKLKARGSDPWSIAAAVLAVPAATATAWFVIGDLTTTEPAGADYIFRQPAWLSEHESVIGVVSIALLAIALLVLVLRWHQRETRTEWRTLTILWVAAGIGIGLTERTVTMGVIGANIGGGALLLFVVPAGMLVLIVMSVGLIRSGRRAASPPKADEPSDGRS